MNTKTFYDPIENRLITNRTQGHGDNWVNIGCKKIAEAMTSVSEKERPLVWNAVKFGAINLSLVNSKIRHKLKKLKIVKNYNFEYKSGYFNYGEFILNKINKKYNLK